MGNKMVLSYIYWRKFYEELEAFILFYIERNSMGKKFLLYIHWKEFYEE